MSSVNKVILIGNLGAAPESRFLPDGSQVCNLRMATTDKWRDKISGEMREATEWHRVVLYRKLAEIANKYLKKGSSVYVEGSLRNRTWKDREGNDRFTTEIEATAMEMLSSIRDPNAASVPQPPTKPTVSAPMDYDDDIIPF